MHSNDTVCLCIHSDSVASVKHRVASSLQVSSSHERDLGSDLIAIRQSKVAQFNHVAYENASIKGSWMEWPGNMSYAGHVLVSRIVVLSSWFSRVLRAWVASWTHSSALEIYVSADWSNLNIIVTTTGKVAYAFANGNNQFQHQGTIPNKTYVYEGACIRNDRYCFAKSICISSRVCDDRRWEQCWPTVWPIAIVRHHFVAAESGSLATPGKKFGRSCYLELACCMSN